ncbi:hypothetical protein DC498_15770 [Terrimonas sp.]|uniref:hypothetical protein n=1 Tax=Terrimonas sp. TaxID=1914338 RepID=UPI000D50684C|nr:hypothetical protein [Terrimonas sp.]PVD51332.1 hypothetical protein DC498_15770 [Terrimonas sp.]
MKKIIIQSILLTGLLFMFASCKKEFAADGGVSDAHVNMTTYDYLKSKPIFSSLVTLIDRAGLKDMVNSNCTFFATTNYGIDEYLKAMKNIRAVELDDENITYTLDSIPLFRVDSLKTYIFDGQLGRDALTTSGKYYTSKYGDIPNVQFKLWLDRTYNYGAYVDYVDYVAYTKIIGTDDSKELDINDIPVEERDKTVYVQSSGIITTNGVVHALDGYHRLFFNTDNAN